MKKLSRLILFAGLLPIAGSLWAQTQFAEGDLSYTVLSGNEVKVDGLASGSSVTDLTIPGTVTHEGTNYNVTTIGDKAFYKNASIVTVSMGEGITTIGEYSFADMGKLATVNFPTTIRNFADYSFGYDNYLNNVVIPEGVEYLSTHCFAYAKRMTSITLPETLKELTSDVFYMCLSMAQITIPKNVKSIGAWTFASWDNIKMVTCLAPEPPELSGATFRNTPIGNARLIVPDESVPLYQQNTEGWSDFGLIMGVSRGTSGLYVSRVKGVAFTELGTAFNVPIEVYNYDTKRVDTITYELTYQGKTETKTLDLGDRWIAADPSEIGIINIPFDAIDTEGQYPVTLNITKVNGEDNTASQTKIEFFIIATNGTELPKDCISFTYSDQPLKSKLGLMLATDRSWDACALIKDASLTGMKIVGFTARNLNAPDEYPYTNTYGWVSHTLSHQPDAAVMKGTIDSDNNMTIAFVEPVEMPDSGLYVGYSLNTKANYPIPYCEPTGIPGSLYATYDGMTFQDYSSEGCLPITVYFTGASLDNSVGLQPYEGDAFAVKDEVYSLTFNVSNAGTNAVNKIGYAYTINGKTQEGEANVELPATMGAGGSFNVECEALDATGKNTGTMVVTTVNGEKNNSANNTQDVDVKVLSFRAANYPLVEEGTGTWCRWCTRGWLGMKLMNEQYPGFVGVAWHNNDPMTVNDVPVTFSGYPQGKINRQPQEIDIYGGTGSPDKFGMLDLYKSLAAVPAIASIDVETEYNADETELTVRAATTFATDAKGYKIGYILATDSLCHGKDAYWGQANEYSGKRGYTGYLEMLVDMSNPILGLVFDDVAINGKVAKGVAGSLPQEAKMDETYNTEYTFNTKSVKGINSYEHLVEGNRVDAPYDLIEDKSKVYVVVSLIAPDGTIANSSKCYAGKKSGVKEVVAQENPEAPVSYYNLQGQRVMNPVHGQLYIKVQGKKATKIMI